MQGARELKTIAAEALIIGAGLSGLTVAHALQEAGVDFLMIDAAQAVGASWAARHPGLRLNTHRNLSALPGHAYPAGTGAFPSRDEVENHLRSFAERHRIGVEFGVRAERIERSEGGFAVIAGSRTFTARTLILATGQEHTPFVPDWRGAEGFTGEIVHSSAFQAAASYDGKRVLVAGGGNSGFDVLNHLSKAAPAKLWLSARSGSAVLPKRLFGQSLHRNAALVDRLPTPAADLVIAALQRLAFGDLARLGWPKPKAGGATRLREHGHAIPIDDGTIAAIASGKIELVPDISHFEGADIVFADGRRAAPDIIIAATGYRSNFAQLFAPEIVDGEGRIAADRSGRALTVPGLWVIGQYPTLQSYFRTAQMQARAVARELSGR